MTKCYNFKQLLVIIYAIKFMEPENNISKFVEQNVGPNK